MGNWIQVFRLANEMYITIQWFVSDIEPSEDDRYWSKNFVEVILIIMKIVYIKKDTCV